MCFEPEIRDCAGPQAAGPLDHNFCEDGYPRDEVHGFIVDASSSFYSEFGRAITEEVDRWLDERYANHPSEEDYGDEDSDERASASITAKVVGKGPAGEGQPLDLMNLPFDPAEAAARACGKKQTGQ